MGRISTNPTKGCLKNIEGPQILRPGERTDGVYIYREENITMDEGGEICTQNDMDG